MPITRTVNCCWRSFFKVLKGQKAPEKAKADIYLRHRDLLILRTERSKKMLLEMSIQLPPPVTCAAHPGYDRVTKALENSFRSSEISEWIGNQQELRAVFYLDDGASERDLQNAVVLRVRRIFYQHLGPKTAAPAIAFRVINNGGDRSGHDTFDRGRKSQS